MKTWNRAVVARLVMLACVPVLAFAQEAPAPEAAQVPTLEAVLVTGAVPGPGLWRVSRSGHELYLLGTVSPLPSNMEWVSSEVEGILAHTNEVISPGGAVARVGAGDAFKIALLARSAFAATKIPAGKKLADVLPPQVFREWTAMKAKYFGNARDIERSRPMFASQDLYYAAISTSGMTQENIVWERVAALAKEKRIPVIDTTVRFPLNLDRGKYKAGIAALAGARVDETTCFARTLATLESDLRTMRDGALAWATGDLESLQTLGHTQVEPACKQTYDELMGFQRSPAVEAEADATWLAAATSALQRNDVTFAVVPIAELVGPTGVLARLRAEGCEIEAPGDDSHDVADGGHALPGA